MQHIMVSDCFPTLARSVILSAEEGLLCSMRCLHVASTVGRTIRCNLRYLVVLAVKCSLHTCGLPVLKQ